jgi:hypothetical protein
MKGRSKESMKRESQREREREISETSKRDEEERAERVAGLQGHVNHKMDVIECTSQARGGGNAK